MDPCVLRYCRRRELDDRLGIAFQRKLQVTDYLIHRIGLEAELEGHSGCVNCLEWNQNGMLLASGSDDQQIIIWDPFLHRKIHSIQTGHHGNIFSVKFLPSSNDATLVSGAADFKIRVHDLLSKETTYACSCHWGRVKRIATISNVPFMFWSAAEDGTVMQFDLRLPHTCAATCNNVLINLTNHMGKHTEAKCLAINQYRPEMLAVGANDPYVRVYDRRMITPTTYPLEQNDRLHRERAKDSNTVSDDNLPHGCVQYYVPGHLPFRHMGFRKRYRALAATYLTFSPDGNELLVNLGGEQIYLFDVLRSQLSRSLDLQCFSWLQASAATKVSTNGFKNKHCNGASLDKISDGPSKQSPVSLLNAANSPCDTVSRYSSKCLPPKAEFLKQKANAVFEKQQYTLAIDLYNRALQVAPDSAILYGNRAAALMKRCWDGDVYAALRDCRQALLLDPEHLKAHFRLARCCLELQWAKEAAECLELFRKRFPAHAQSRACEALHRDINAAVLQAGNACSGACENVAEGSGARTTVGRKLPMSEYEKEWRAMAFDYSFRYCGHCNTTTDIKEANFFGSNGQYVIAGSDDGSFFMWDRFNTNIVRILRGDDSIVNCLQPHPSQCFLATSGIDPVVRLWSPKPQDGQRDDREVTDSEDAAVANQKRMNADPLEQMLMNMGYRIRSVLEGDEDDSPERSEVQCRPS